MTIRAVVLDIGNVLEVNDDTLFPGPFLARHGLGPDALASLDRTALGDPVTGGATESEVRAHYRDGLGLSEEQADELMEDLWTWYVGELDRPMRDWFAGLRPRGLVPAILSNSGPGARERERCWGFEDLTDVLVYSHEVGLAKPDPAIFELTTSLLGVRPEEVVFVDDAEVNCAAARSHGWAAVHHTGDTAATIAAVERLIAS